MSLDNQQYSGVGGRAGLPLSRYQRYSTTNVDVALENHRNTLAPHSETPTYSGQFAIQVGESPANFKCTHNVIDLKNIAIHAVAYDAPISIIDETRAKKILSLVLVIDGYCEVDDGEKRFSVGPNQMFVINTGQTTKGFTSPNLAYIVVRIEVSAITPLLVHMMGRSTAAPLHFETNPSQGNPAADSLARFLRLLCVELDADESPLKYDHVSAAYEQALLALLLTSIPHNYSEWLSFGVPAAAPHYVVKAERFIRENLLSSITLEDILAASGVGRRSLQKGFRQFRCLTPMLYLKECRLQYARTQLQNPALMDRRIAEVAHQAGFEHPSKFCQYYRSRFNELPSETRRWALLDQIPSRLDS
jgi:AraC-like DNA-binding protein